MKRKWKWLVLAAVLLIIFASWLVVNSAGNVTVDVVGTLPDKDVAEIVALAKHKLRKEILPDFSWRSIRNSPAAFRRYSRIKFHTIVPNADASNAMVVVWCNTNGVKLSEPGGDYWSAEQRNWRRRDFLAT